MKAFMFTLLILAGNIVVAVAQCSISGWTRGLPNSSYTWAWDGNLDGVDLLPVSFSSASSAVNTAITEAIAKWRGASGNIVTITPASSYANANIKIRFADLGAATSCGDAGALLIRINKNVRWTNDLSKVGVGADNRYDINSTVLHEMGHIFGAGHISLANSVMGKGCNAQVVRALHSCEAQAILNAYNVPYTVTVKNSFGGGNVKVDGTTHTNIPASGKVFTWNTNTFPHTLEAIDGQSSGGYVQRYRDWKLPNQTLNATNPRSVPVPSSSSVTYEANFRKEFNVTFQNSFVGAGNGGTIKVNGTNRNSPYTTQVIQDNSITADAVYQVINGIEYVFDHWGDGSTATPKTFTPTDHVTSPPYSAYFVGKPLHVTITSSSGPVGSNVRIVWQEHPNPNVTKYQVWRKVKHSLTGTTEGPTLLVTLNRGTTSYTDYSYTYTGGYSVDLLDYDIRAYYATEGAYATPYWISVFGEGEIARVQTKDVFERIVPTEYAIANYPNPFNPATKIYYQLVDDAHVTLEIYDILGRRTIRLLEDHLNAGSYAISWNGSDASGKVLASGMYLARLIAKPMRGGQTRVLTRRMLLMKIGQGYEARYGENDY